MCTCLAGCHPASEVSADVQTRRDQRAQANMVLRRMQYVKQGYAWRAWRARVAVCKEKRVKAYRAGCYWRKLQAAKAFRTWVDVLAWRHEKRRIVQKCAPPLTSLLPFCIGIRDPPLIVSRRCEWG